MTSRTSSSATLTRLLTDGSRTRADAEKGGRHSSKTLHSLHDTRGVEEVARRRFPNPIALSAIAASPSTDIRAALMWHMDQMEALAVMVLDHSAKLLHANSKAESMIEAGRLIALDRAGRLLTTNGRPTDLVQEIRALSDHGDPEDRERLILLDGQAPEACVPLILSPCPGFRPDRGMVIATVPSAPAKHRVEALARCMGLTRAEARVAALLQQGMSNRDAAVTAGVTQRTLETYAKRVFSKINLSRGELIRKLTWQAGGW